MCWSTTIWRHRMRGASGSMPRFRTSAKPRAPTRNSESRSSWGEDLPSWVGGCSPSISPSRIFSSFPSLFSCVIIFLSLSSLSPLSLLSLALPPGVQEMLSGTVKFSFWMKSTKWRKPEPVRSQLQMDSLNVRRDTSHTDTVQKRICQAVFCRSRSASSSPRVCACASECREERAGV